MNNPRLLSLTGMWAHVEEHMRTHRNRFGNAVSTNDLVKLKSLLEKTPFENCEKCKKVEYRISVSRLLLKANYSKFVKGVELELNHVGTWSLEKQFCEKTTHGHLISLVENCNSSAFEQYEILKIFFTNMQINRFMNSHRYEPRPVLSVKHIVDWGSYNVLNIFLKSGLGIDAIEVWYLEENIAKGHWYGPEFAEMLKLLLAAGSVQADYGPIGFNLLFQDTDAKAFRLDKIDFYNLILQYGLTSFTKNRYLTDIFIKKLKNRDQPHCDRIAKCLQTHIENPMSLKCLTRIAVRNAILKTNKFVNLEERVYTLSIPKSVKFYLMWFKC